MKLRSIVFFLLTFCFTVPCYAASTLSVMDYGVVHIPNSQDSVYIVYDEAGNVVSTSNCEAPAATPAYYTEDSTRSGTFTLKSSQNANLGSGTCSITFSSLVSPGFSIPPSPAQTTLIYKNLNIKRCEPGEYQGTVTGLQFRSASVSLSTFSLQVHIIIEGAAANVAIENTKDLNFGSMLASAAHNVTIDYNGNRSGNANYLLNASDNPHQAGEFVIRNEGSSAATVQIQLPSSAIISRNGSNPLNVVNFTSNQQTNQNISIPANGSITANIGATLQVTQGAPAGDYSGEYTVTINY